MGSSSWLAQQMRARGDHWIRNIQRRFLLQGCFPSSAQRRILQDCLAYSREEDLHNNKTSSSSSSSSSSSLYHRHDLADLHIKVGDRVFPCHQLLLTLRSDYFKTRLYRRTDFLHHNGGELPLLEEDDVSAEAFEKMLEYVYTDEIEDLGDDDDPLRHAEELLDLASKFLLFGLKRVVADLMPRHLNLDRLSPTQLCRWLVLSDIYEVAKIQEHCLNIIAWNTKAFAQFRPSLPSDGHSDIAFHVSSGHICKSR